MSSHNKKMEELQIVEGQLQSFLMQKQTMQFEINEIENALTELKKTNDEVYKLTSGIMLKADKKNLTKELEAKKKNADGKIQAIEKQEKLLLNRGEQLRKDVRNEISDENEK